MNTLKKWSNLGYTLLVVPIFLSAPSLAAVPAQHYTVAKGDCLWTIAAGMFGDPFEWPLLYDANKGRIADPDLIQPGWSLTVPASPTASQVAAAVAFARQYKEPAATVPAEEALAQPKAQARPAPPPAAAPPPPSPVFVRVVLGLALLIVVALLSAIALGIQRLMDSEEIHVKAIPRPVPDKVERSVQPMETVVAKPAETVSVQEAPPDPATQPTESEAIVRAEQGPDPEHMDTHQHAA